MCFIAHGRGIREAKGRSFQNGSIIRCYTKGINGSIGF